MKIIDNFYFKEWAFYLVCLNLLEALIAEPICGSLNLTVEFDTLHWYW